MTSSTSEPQAAPPSSGGHQRSLDSQVATTRIRYVVAIALMVIAWLLWSYGSQAVTFAAVGRGRLDHVLTTLVAITPMLAAWAVLPGSLGRRSLAALTMLVYMGSVVLIQVVVVVGLVPEAFPWRILSVFAALMPVLFLRSWFFARRARFAAYLLLIPVTVVAIVDGLRPMRIHEILGWQQVLWEGDWVLVLYGNAFGIVSTALLITMAWAARNKPLRESVRRHRGTAGDAAAPSEPPPSPEPQTLPPPPPGY